MPEEEPEMYQPPTPQEPEEVLEDDWLNKGIYAPQKFPPRSEDDDMFKIEPNQLPQVEEPKPVENKPPAPPKPKDNLPDIDFNITPKEIH
jgi:hypothetical protein